MCLKFSNSLTTQHLFEGQTGLRYSNGYSSFADISGLQMNPQKTTTTTTTTTQNKQTEARWFGQNKDSKQKYHSLKWITQIKILAVHFRNDISKHFRIHN